MLAGGRSFLVRHSENVHKKQKGVFLQLWITKSWLAWCSCVCSSVPASCHSLVLCTVASNNSGHAKQLPPRLSDLAFSSSGGGAYTVNVYGNGCGEEKEASSQKRFLAMMTACRLFPVTASTTGRTDRLAKAADEKKGGDFTFFFFPFLHLFLFPSTPMPHWDGRGRGRHRGSLSDLLTYFLPHISCSCPTPFPSTLTPRAPSLPPLD